MHTYIPLVCSHAYIHVICNMLYKLEIYMYVDEALVNSIYVLYNILYKYRVSGFIRWEVIFAFFASDEEFAKIVKLLL